MVKWSVCVNWSRVMDGLTHLVYTDPPGTSEHQSCAVTKLVRWHIPVIPAHGAFGRQRLEGQEFKAIVSCVMSSKPVWGLLDPVSKEQK